MDTIVFIIYTISLLSAAVCLWVKWDQDEDKHRMSALERRIRELEEQLFMTGSGKSSGKSNLWK